jgi:hypothetical protein
MDDAAPFRVGDFVRVRPERLWPEGIIRPDLRDRTGLVVAVEEEHLVRRYVTRFHNVDMGVPIPMAGPEIARHKPDEEELALWMVDELSR